MVVAVVVVVVVVVVAAATAVPQVTESSKNVVFSAGVRHEPRVAGLAALKKHDKFFTMDLNEDFRSSVTQGDICHVGTWDATVVKVDQLSPTSIFVDVDRPAIV